MYRILNLTTETLSDDKLQNGFYEVSNDKKDRLLELLTFNISFLTPHYLRNKAHELAHLALTCNSNPMVPSNNRAVYINPPAYFSKYLENALLDVNLKPIYIIDNTLLVITEKKEIPDINIDITEQMSFEDLRKIKIQEIEYERWKEETSPYYFEPKEVRFDTSERSQIKYIQARDDQIEETIEWKTYDGWVMMNHDDLVELIQSYKEYVRLLFKKEAILTHMIMGVEEGNIDQLNIINWGMLLLDNIEN